jgi:hypothetical protein
MEQGMASIRARAKKGTLSFGGNDDERGALSQDTADFFNEFEHVITEMRAQGASGDEIKDRIAELHMQKREDQRRRRLSMLREKQQADEESLLAEENLAKAKLNERRKEQTDLASVVNAVKGGDAADDDAAAAGAGGSAASADMDPDVAEQFERERRVIERRYKRQQLEREARNAVNEAFEYAKLEFRQDAALQKRLKAKAEELAANAAGDADGKQTAEMLANLMAGADADREAQESAQDLEKQRQRERLAAQLAANRRANKEKVGKKKELELRAANRNVEEANRDGVLQRERDKVREAIGKLPEGDQRKLGKKVAEMVMAGRHNREMDNIIADQIEARQAFVLQAMQSAQARGLPINLNDIEEQAGNEFDERHAREVQQLVRAHHDQVRQAYAYTFPDEEFLGPEWVVQEGNENAEYARRRREAMGRIAENAVDQAELKRVADEAAARQRAHEERLKAEQDALEKLTRDMEAKGAQHSHTSACAAGQLMQSHCFACFVSHLMYGVVCCVRACVYVCVQRRSASASVSSWRRRASDVNWNCWRM